MKRTIEAEITPTPEELANEWWKLDANEQARFFNQLSRFHLIFQLQHVMDSPALSPAGRQVMEDIGEYARGYL